jgi:hypothetical protein
MTFLFIRIICGLFLPIKLVYIKELIRSNNGYYKTNTEPVEICYERPRAF